MNKVTRFAGPLCVGQSHAEAVEHFRNAVTGADTMVYVSNSGTAYLSNSGVTLLDPENESGEMIASESLAKRIDFSSVSSAGDIQANYTICLDGCGSHIVSESAVSHCPSCSADVSDVDEDRINEHLSASYSIDSQSNSLVVVGASRQEAVEAFATALSSATAFVAESSTGTFNSGVSAIQYDPRTGAEVTSVSDAQDSTESVSCSLDEEGQVEAHVYSCSASCDNPFTVSSDEEPVFCAHCSAPLIDIEEEDIEEDDDGVSVDFVEDDEEDEDSESGAAKDEIESKSSDDGEDDDDDEDDDDEDDDDEDDDLEDDDEGDDDGDDDDEDDDEDEEDWEESESSVSSAKRKGVHVESLSKSKRKGRKAKPKAKAKAKPKAKVRSKSESCDDLDSVVIEEEFESESNKQPEVVMHTFDSVSAARAKGAFDPALISLSRSTGSSVSAVHMFLDGEPLARTTYASLAAASSEELAAKNFNSDNFIKAISTSVATYGVDKTLTDFGFMSYSMTVNVDAVNQANVEAQIQAASNSIQEEVADAVNTHIERFEAALSTAMLGNTKQFWKDSNNPIAESLASVFRNAGIKDPVPAIDRCFVVHSPEFLRQSISRAKAIAAQSEITQNELAESVSAAAGIVRQSGTVVTQNAQQPQNASATSLLSESSVQSVSASQPVDDFEAKLSRLTF